MSRLTYQQEAIQELAAKLKKKGFRVFIAERGSYGFYTNEEGSKVVSFQYDLGGFSFSGNYKTSNPRRTGAGWQIVKDSYGCENFQSILDSVPPKWATRGATWKYTTLEQHLASYQKSSKYKEIV